MARLVNCPVCGKSVEWTEAAAYRPFCSKRCRTMDLGAWAEERYRVPVVEDKDDPDSSVPTENERGGSPR
jgi:endogenous inhibitor of DNA gyrase (YacG/DUF329 family)